MNMNIVHCVKNEDLNKCIAAGTTKLFVLKDLRYRGDRVTDPHRNSMADELATMANTDTGVFVLGADDKTKTITGIPEEKLDSVETWLRDIANDRINPPLLLRIRKVPVIAEDGVERVIIRVDVPKSLYIHQSPGGYLHRIGSSKRQMTPEILARNIQQRSQTRIIRFDEQPVANADPECLDRDIWGKFRTPLSPEDDREFLLKLKLLTADNDGNIRPSVSGILMACENPQEYLTNAYIQAVAYRGDERNAAYQNDAKDITGPLDRQIVEAYRFVQRNMKVMAEKQPERQDIPQYSMQAVFEAVVNAVAHRDYSIQGAKIRLHLFADRLEVFSPGTIPNTMTVESISLRQSARNELVASLLARCPITLDNYKGSRSTIMDKRGEGVPIILTESEKLSGKRPEYHLIDDTELLLRIFAADKDQEG